MSYIKVTMKFKNRYRTIKFEKQKIVDEISADCDLLVDSKYRQLDVMLPANNILSINILGYRQVLFQLKKMLNLKNVNQMLNLILQRDERCIKVVLGDCDDEELKAVLATLVVYSDSRCSSYEKLTVLFSENEFEEFSKLPLHHFFRVFNEGMKDDRLFKFPRWIHFAKLVSEKTAKEQK